MKKPHAIRRALAVSIAAISAAVAVSACIEPPPRIPAIPASGLSVRVYVFGASAEDVRQGFDAVKDNNPSFNIVPSVIELVGPRPR